MNKEEFLHELRVCLNGKMSPADVDANVDYYRAYIEGEVMKGRSEAEVLEELGSPRLIAKNLTANRNEEQEDRRNSYYEESDRAAQGTQDNNNSRNNSGGYYNSRNTGGYYNNGNRSGGAYDQNSGQRKKGGTAKTVLNVIIVAVIIILCFLIIFALFSGGMYLFIRLFPVFIIALIVLIIYRLWKYRR